MAGLDGGTDILHHALRDIEHVEAKLLGAFVVPAVDPAMEILRTANTCDARTHMRRTHIASSLLAHRQHTGSTQAAHRQHSPQPETRLLRTCLTQTSNTSGTPPPTPHTHLYSNGLRQNGHLWTADMHPNSNRHVAQLNCLSPVPKYFNPTFHVVNTCLGISTL